MVADMILSTLLESEKFLNWNRRTKFKIDNPKFSAAEEHFSPAKLAELWGVSAETVRVIFREEPGVLRYSVKSNNRKYITMRIPKSVAERVHRRLSAVPA
jgi:hypothetical protein